MWLISLSGEKFFLSDDIKSGTLKNLKEDIKEDLTEIQVPFIINYPKELFNPEERDLEYLIMFLKIADFLEIDLKPFQDKLVEIILEGAKIETDLDEYLLTGLFHHFVKTSSKVETFFKCFGLKEGYFSHLSYRMVTEIRTEHYDIPIPNFNKAHDLLIGENKISQADLDILGDDQSAWIYCNTFYINVLNQVCDDIRIKNILDPENKINFEDGYTFDVFDDHVLFVILTYHKFLIDPLITKHQGVLKEWIIDNRGNRLIYGSDEIFFLDRVGDLNIYLNKEIKKYPYDKKFVKIFRMEKFILLETANKEIYRFNSDGLFTKLIEEISILETDYKRCVYQKDGNLYWTTKKKLFTEAVQIKGDGDFKKTEVGDIGLYVVYEKEGTVYRRCIQSNFRSVWDEPKKSCWIDIYPQDVLVWKLNGTTLTRDGKIVSTKVTNCLGSVWVETL